MVFFCHILLCIGCVHQGIKGESVNLQAFLADYMTHGIHNIVVNFTDMKPDFSANVCYYLMCTLKTISSNLNTAVGVKYIFITFCLYWFTFIMSDIKYMNFKQHRITSKLKFQNSYFCQTFCNKATLFFKLSAILNRFNSEQDLKRIFYSLYYTLQMLVRQQCIT
jgi:hypothetical protein